MEYIEYLTRVVKEMRNIVAGTVDDAGMPSTCIVEMLDADAEGLYFLVDRTSGFYERLSAKKSMACTGMSGSSAEYSASVALRGRVEEMGSGLVLPLLEKSASSRERRIGEEAPGNLTVFRLYQATGEWTERCGEDFGRVAIRFGDERMNAGLSKKSYFITDDCDGCRACVSKCPEGCIDVSMVPAVIDQERCTRCGNCEMACFQEAIVIVK